MWRGHLSFTSTELNKIFFQFFARFLQFAFVFRMVFFEFIKFGMKLEKKLFYFINCNKLSLKWRII